MKFMVNLEDGSCEKLGHINGILLAFDAKQKT